jgi:hypothetical protein
MVFSYTVMSTLVSPFFRHRCRPFATVVSPFIGRKGDIRVSLSFLGAQNSWRSKGKTSNVSSAISSLNIKPTQPDQLINSPLNSSNAGPNTISDG